MQMKSLGESSFYLEGQSFFEKGAYEKALEMFTQAMREMFGNAELFASIALCYRGLKRFNEANLFYRKALQIAPNAQDLRLSYAQFLNENKKFEQALMILSQSPSDAPEYFFTLGNALEGKGSSVDAIKNYQKALSLNPGFVECLFGIALCYIDMDENEKSLEIIEKIKKCTLNETQIASLLYLFKLHEKFSDIIAFVKNADALDPDLRLVLAEAYLGEAQFERAEKMFRALLIENAFCQGAMNGLAYLHYCKDQYQEAERYFQESLQFKESAEVCAVYSRMLEELGRQEESASMIKRGENCEDFSHAFYLKIARNKMDLRDYETAISYCQKTLALAPDSLSSKCGIAVNALEIEDIELAEKYADDVLRCEPNHRTVEFVKAIVRFHQNRLEDGWRFYEHRRNLKGQFHIKQDDFFPEAEFWKGQDLKDKKVFVWSEQGVGDEIMFASCYHDIIASARFCIIECGPRLYTLFARSFPNAFLMPQSMKGDEVDKTRILENLYPFRPIDYAVPSGTLPLYFRKKIEDFPKKAYLKPDPFLVRIWAERYKSLGKGYKIGICWRSGLLTKLRRQYYLSIDDFAPLFELPNIQWINMQYGECEEELQHIESKLNVKISRWKDVNLKDEFEKVAAMMVNLDLVITVETAVGELAGALGVEVWRLSGSPDWTTLGQEKRPWYPNMTSFTRRYKDTWKDVLGQVREALISRLSQCRNSEAAKVKPSGL